eukprot:CAMPEP_0172309222 /NCGR_PEP_ID=MMETSP1058-20130122/9576_1 /TAXON_ID=83371 /ORGANISM="Detonula confervacea, Strain CCMP 353" /LENGTH=203 /DNA_ID=CAMNT_0013021807 /DNA_START=24 /DNA_END=635 /DNA_ORIENTATION=-
MPSFRLSKCLCSIGQIAMAALILGQAPSSLAFAPSIISQTATASTRRLSQYSAIPLPHSTSSAAAAMAAPFNTNPRQSKALYMSEQNDEPKKSSLPVFLDPGTKGGAVVLSVLLFILPLVIYQVAIGPFGVDEIDAGRYIGVGFTVFTMLLWGATYIFRVATKDMTYAKQLKDYEDAVIAKRLEELDEDEVQALVEDIERDEF